MSSEAGGRAPRRVMPVPTMRSRQTRGIPANQSSRSAPHARAPDITDRHTALRSACSPASFRTNRPRPPPSLARRTRRKPHPDPPLQCRARAEARASRERSRGGGSGGGCRRWWTGGPEEEEQEEGEDTEAAQHVGWRQCGRHHACHHKHEAGGGSVLQRKMAAQPAGAQFRRINEELYTTFVGRWRS